MIMEVPNYNEISSLLLISFHQSTYCSSLGSLRTKFSSYSQVVCSPGPIPTTQPLFLSFRKLSLRSSVHILVLKSSFLSFDVLKTKKRDSNSNFSGNRQRTSPSRKSAPSKTAGCSPSPSWPSNGARQGCPKPQSATPETTTPRQSQTHRTRWASRHRSRTHTEGRIWAW